MAVLLLVPAGVLAGHALGYNAAGQVHGGPAATAGHPHGYLAAAAPVATVLALLALAGVAIGRAGRGTVSFRSLLALQWAALLVQEGVEHALAGEPVTTLLTSPALWLSLAGQMAAAAGALLLVRSVRGMGARLVGLAAVSARPFVLPGFALAGRCCRRLHSRVGWTLAARGPPLLLA